MLYRLEGESKEEEDISKEETKGGDNKNSLESNLKKALKQRI
jgi:hypothetical protein